MSRPKVLKPVRVPTVILEPGELIKKFDETKEVLDVLYPSPETAKLKTFFEKFLGWDK